MKSNIKSKKIGMVLIILGFSLSIIQLISHTHSMIPFSQITLVSITIGIGLFVGGLLITISSIPDVTGNSTTEESSEN